MVESSAWEQKEVNGKHQMILNLQMQVREFKGADGWEAYSDETSPVPPSARMSLWFSNLDERGRKALEENMSALGYVKDTDPVEWAEALPGFKVGFMVEESVSAKNGRTYYNAKYPGDFETYGSKGQVAPNAAEMEAVRRTVASLFTDIAPRPKKTYTPPPLPPMNEEGEVALESTPSDEISGDNIPF